MAIARKAKSSSAAGRTRRRHVLVLKRTYGHLLELPSRRLVRTAAEDDFVICRNARIDMYLCYQVDV